MTKTYYITTPLYYSNDNMHIGHTYTTVLADALARYKKLRGYDVKFLTGSDDHGQKIERIAKEKNMEPNEYVDKISQNTIKLWKTMNVEYDIFMRTTAQFHISAVQKIFKQLYDQGDIYKSYYEGLYCIPCETFYTEKQLIDNKCPDCKRSIEKVKEESYFFKLSNYQDRLLKHMEENEEFIQPKSRQNEMINNFIKPGLEDLCVSRTSFKWGIPVSFDDKHVVYVWIDALSNYITALGYGCSEDGDYKKYWPADVHIVGKDIVRFHTIIWPCILMALGEPLPKKVYGHGFLVIDGEKMSKSKGNVVDPHILVNRYGVDAIRYFLMREMTLGQDSNFSNEALVQRINSDLANDLGNLLSRTVGMIEKYFNSKVDAEQSPTEFDESIISFVKDTVIKVENYMDTMEVNEALASIWALISRTNKYTDETSPWILIKDETQRHKLANVMYILCEVLRIVSILIEPFMPNTPKLIQTQLNIKDNDLLCWESAKIFGLLPKDICVSKGNIIFPRLDTKKEMDCLNKELKMTSKNTNEDQLLASIEDFSKLNFKVGQVIESEKLKGSDKLLKSQVKIGTQTKQIISGIAQHYNPKQLIGKSVIVVTNLKPVKLRGELSEGMILAASDEEGNLKLITTDGEIKDGAVVK